MTAKAIPSMFEGTIYRSRLEARFAKFLDALGEPAAYESEGFDLPSGRYVPDFRLPRCRTWLELKPVDPTPRARALCRDLCEERGELVVMMYGDFGAWLDQPSREWSPYSGLVWTPRPGPDGDTIAEESHRWWPCVCPGCGRFGFSYEGDGGDICRRLKRQCDGIGEGRFTFEHPDILKAVAAANAERFW